jgi:predicted MPP superfamily phosphohydrolase
MPETDEDPTNTTTSRRRFLGLSLGLAGLGGICGVETFWLEPDRLEITRHTVRLPNLPDCLDGATIVQFTDLHLGNLRGAHRKALEWVDKAEPDLVVCTGDLVEAPSALPEFERFASSLADAASDILAVLGNWERRRSEHFTETLANGYERAGIPLLHNESVALDNGLVIAGGDDPVTDHFSARKTFSDLPKGAATLFIVHAPGVFDRELPVSRNFDLSLAGHTHGGQFRFGPWAPVTPRGSGRFVNGWYDTRFGDAYVSRGVGMTYIRGRFLCTPELPVFTLRPA